MDAILETQKQKKEKATDIRGSVNGFMEGLLKARKPEEVAQCCFNFQLAFSQNETELTNMDLEETISKIRRIPEHNRSIAANMIMHLWESERSVSNLWILITLLNTRVVHVMIQEEEIRKICHPHMQCSYLELAAKENQNFAQKGFKRDREFTSRQERQQSSSTQARTCYHCGGNRHFATACLLKDHPNANQDSKKVWADSDGGTLQREANVARITGDTSYLNQMKIVRRDMKGGTTVSDTPAESVKKLTPGDGNKAANNSSSYPNKAPRTNMDGNARANKGTGAKFPTKKGTWTKEALSLKDTINNITELQTNQNLDFDSVMHRISNEDKQFDEHGRRRRYTKCILANGQHWIESYFFPDDGSIGEILSGSYIKRSYFSKINETLQLPTFRHDKEVNLGAAFTGTQDEIVSEFIYLHIEYPSRTQDRTLRACLKIYIVDNLRVNICIGKADLLSNDFIESKHLHGYGKEALSEVSKDDALLAYLEEKFGTFSLEGEAPIVTRVANARTVLKEEMLDLMAHLADEERSEAIPLVSNRSDHDNVEYFQDIDEAEDYDEGTLPSEVFGSPRFKERIKKLNTKFKSIFSKELLKQPALVEPFVLKIDKNKWFSTKKFQGLRSMSFPKQQALGEYLNAGENILFKFGNAQITSPVNMVPKPEAGKWRMTCDFRALNECCEKSDFPIPKIQDIFAEIARRQDDAKVFAKIDLTQGFFQVPLAEESQIYTAFKSFRGIHMFLRMPMGTNGAPQHFQYCMTQVLKDIPGWGRCIHLYIDDIFVHARTEEELAELVEKIYAALDKHKLCINPKKTIIGAKKIEYLGHTITSEGYMEVSESKKRALFEFPKPRVKKQLKSFLGILTTFKDNIEEMATIAKPLHQMCGTYSKATADRVLIWSKEADEAFEKIKEAINKMPNLKLKGNSKEYKLVLRTDASDYGCGAQLVQKLRTSQDDKEILGEDETIMFVSKAFDETQKKWCTSEKECYAVWYACKKLEFLLEGERFHIETDHKNLTILDESANAKVQRWKAYLQRYDATWTYIKGSTNVWADAMSRIVDIPIEDNSKIKGYEESDMIELLFEELDELELTENKNIEDTINEIVENGRSTRSNKNLSQVEQEFLTKAIQKVHNTLDGHFGVKRTTDLLTRFINKLAEQGDIPKGINLPRLSLARKMDAVKSFLDRCAICQKASESGKKILTVPFTTSSYAPHECIQIDHIGPFQMDANTKATHILTVIDTFTRWVELYPVKSTSEHDNIEAITDYCLRYGKPRCILSDHGSGFVGCVFKMFGQLAGIDLQTPEHVGDKQRLGIVERENREVRRHLTQLTQDLSLKHRWPIATKFVQRIINNAVHSSTGIAPAKLMYGTLITSPEQPLFSLNDEEAVSRSDYLRDKLEIQRKVINYMQNYLQENDRANFARQEINRDAILQKSELVLYRVLNKTKQELVWEGPYIMTNSQGDWYELTSITNDKKPFYAHARQLKRYKQDPDRPNLEVAHKDDAGTIASIEDHFNPEKHANNKRGVKIGVKYLNYPDDLQWLPLREVENSQLFVKYCLDRNLTCWISNTARSIHAKFIADYRHSKLSAQVKP